MVVVSYDKIVIEIFVLFVYICIGYFCVKIKFISETGIQDMSRILVNIAMPALVISSINIEYKPEYIRNMEYLTVLSFAYLTFATVVGKFVVGRLKGEDSAKKSMRYCIIFGNAIFLGYPLSNALFGALGMFYASFFIGMQVIFQWTVGVNIYKGEKISLSNLKKLINPGTVAILIGLCMFSLQIKTPLLADKVLKGIGSISTPLALIIIGATLYGFKAKEIFLNWNIQIITLFKILLFPAVFLCILYFIPIDPILKSILTILVAAPVQASSVVFAKNFKGDPLTASRCVMLSTLLCLATIPMFLMLINLHCA